MARKKVKLAYITHDSTRKATYKKRMKGLLKKVNELCTLCGIDACLLIYSPFETQPVVWPSLLGALMVLGEFNKMSEMEQCKRMLNQESHMRQRLSKENEQLRKQQKVNKEKQMTQVMFNCLAAGSGLDDFNMTDLNFIGWSIDRNLKDIYRRIEILEKEAAYVVANGLKKNGDDTIITGHAHSHAYHMDMIESMQNELGFVDVMNPTQHLSFCGEEMTLPFGDNNQNNFWPDDCFL